MSYDEMKHDESVLNKGCPATLFLSRNEEENLSKFFDARYEPRNPAPMMLEGRPAGTRSVGVVATIVAVVAAVGFVAFERPLPGPSQIAPAAAHAAMK